MHKIRLLLLSLLLLLSVCCASASAESAPYYITVDIANQIVTVYDTNDKSETGIVRQMICSTGVGNATPQGLYVLPYKRRADERTEWHYFAEFHVWAKYATRIHGNYLFHSTLYGHKGATTPTWASNHSLGSKASHGCIRLREEDAKWIARNCLHGTVVCIYDGAERNTDLRERLKARHFSIDETTRELYMQGIAPHNADTTNKEANIIIQKALNKAGYSVGAADGIIGTKTLNALHKWQSENGFESSDQLDDEQTRLLLGDEYEAFRKETEPESEAPLDGEDAVAEDTLKPDPALSYTLENGSRTTGVGELRSALRTLGYVIRDATGLYGDDTEAAVRDYQEKHGLYPSGRCDIDCYTAIIGETTTDVMPHAYYEKGSPADEVQSIQEKLIALGYDLEADGDYGPQTQEAVTAWQKANGLEDTGLLKFEDADRLLDEPVPDPEELEEIDLDDEETAQDEAEADEAKEDEAETPEFFTDNAPLTGTVNMSSAAYYVNVRRSMSADAEVLTKLKHGTKLTVLSEPKGWVKVRLSDGSNGYISDEYVKIDRGEATK